VTTGQRALAGETILAELPPSDVAAGAAP
jgi:phosphatidylserine decarboxylase